MSSSNADWRKRTIYHVFLDRFAGYSHPEKWQNVEFIGGTIAGVTAKLPYIQSLGADAVWLSPFCKGDEYHGYRTTDFYDVDPRFGTIADVKKLLDEAHKRGMKVIMDFVPNHSSNKHPYFLDAVKNRDSKYHDWYFFDKWPRKYRCFFDAKVLPKLNLDNPEVIGHLQGALRHWLGMGFDGVRIDHIIGLSNQNIADLFGPVRKAFPAVVFFGEAWFKGASIGFMRTLRIPKKYRILWMWRFGLNAEKKLYENYIGLIDGVLDFGIADDLLAYAKSNSRWRRSRLRRRIIEKTQLFDNSLLRFTFLDNHDMPRFLYMCGNDKERLKAAAEVQLQLNQPAIIYYGTEVGMTHTQSFKQYFARRGHPDILARQPMPWETDKQDQDLLRFYQQKISERK